MAPMATSSRLVDPVPIGRQVGQACSQPGPDPSVVVRRLLVVLLATGPLALLIVYGLVRDVPPSWNCGDDPPPDSVLDRYRAGAWWLIAGAELLAVSIYLVALSGARGSTSRAIDFTISLAAGASVGLATVIVSSERADHLMAGLVPGLAVGLLVWGVLRAIASRPPSWAAAFQAVLILFGALPLAYVGALVVVFAKATVLVSVGVMFALALAFLLSRLSRQGGSAWPRIAMTAVSFAVVVVPAAGLMVLSRGHGPLAC